MIIDFLLILLGAILIGFNGILPTYSVWPTGFLDAITSLLSNLKIINFIFPVDSLFLCVNIFIHFLIYYYIVRLIIGVVNWARGSGEIKV